ncbi:MAG TPA: sulfatase [Candidatus Paceibacterota bacterium]|nr:sulfatase [Candidatus Paceibacterota bacterium]
MNDRSPLHWINIVLPIIGLVLLLGVGTRLVFAEHMPLAAVVTAVTHGSGNSSSRPSLASATPSPVSTTASSSQKLNVILFLTDDETFESIAKMPYLSSRTDWITFDHAYENVALCCPSRSSILTGEYDTHTGVQNNGGHDNGENLNESATLPVWLHSAGYQTALIGKYLNDWPWGRGLYVPPGWDDWVTLLRTEGSDEYAYFNYDLDDNGSVEHFGSSTEDYETDVLTGKALDFLSTTTTPFFLEFTPHAPHAPFVPAPKYAHTYDSEPVVHHADFHEADVSDKPAYIRAIPQFPLSNSDDTDRRHQWDMMLSLDDSMKAFDQELATRGLASTTVMIFMTDNGYAHGEHRWETKRCPYDVCAETPLLIRYPGQSARHIQNLVTNLDIPATIAEIASTTPNIPQDGASLLPLITGSSTPWRDGVLQHWIGSNNLPDFWSIRTSQYRYTEYGTGEKELYDYSVDPYELTNKAGTSGYVTIQANLAAELADLKADAQSTTTVAMPPRPNYTIVNPNFHDEPSDE